MMEEAGYYFRSRVGLFWIRRLAGNPEYFTLGIADEALGAYLSPEGAADDVYVGSTGHYAWDVRNDPRAPTDLGEWTRGNPD